MTKIKDYDLEFRDKKTDKIFDMDAYDSDVEKGMDPQKAKLKQIKKMQAGGGKKKKE